jgi:hypothetical protein
MSKPKTTNRVRSSELFVPPCACVHYDATDCARIRDGFYADDERYEGYRLKCGCECHERDDYVRELIFSRSASAAMPGDNRRMAATAEEGTARKHVRTVNARTQRKSMFKGDSRKDGILSNDQDERQPDNDGGAHGDAANYRRHGADSGRAVRSIAWFGGTVENACQQFILGASPQGDARHEAHGIITFEKCVWYNRGAMKQP